MNPQTMRVSPKNMIEYEFRMSHDECNFVEIRRIWPSGVGGVVGKRFSYRIWWKYNSREQDLALKRKLLSFTPDEWEAFLMLEAMGEDGVTFN